MSSGYIPPQDEPGPDEILKALRDALQENPRLAQMSEEELARQLVLGGHLQNEPSPALVADMLEALDAEEQGFGPDEAAEEGSST